MSDFIECIRNNPTVKSELTDDNGPAWHIVEDEVREYIQESNQGSCMTYQEAFDIVTSNNQYIEDLEDLGINSGSVLDAMVFIASQAQEAEEIEQIMEQVNELKDVYKELESEGFSVWRIDIGSCSYGFLSHAWESDQWGGTLYYWPDVEGSGPAYVLMVKLDGSDDRIWLYLKKNED